jgi:hypothetical protein
MNIVLIYTHHRRCGPYFYKKACQRLFGRAQVVSAGPWQEHVPPGTDGREPDIRLPDRNPPHYDFAELNLEETHGKAFIKQAIVLLVDGGEDMRIIHCPGGWVHISTEGTHMAWSQGHPHRWAEILCNGADPGVAWLPKAYDPHDHLAFETCNRRLYDLVQLASDREARKEVWRTISERHGDLRTKFGDIWGDEYGDTYRNALSTYVCSTVDFVTTRVFEAMSAGCIVFADRTKSMRALFREDEHFIGFDPIPGPGGEGMPDPDWLAGEVRKLKADPQRASFLRNTAWLESEKHTYDERIRTIMEQLHRVRSGGG